MRSKILAAAVAAVLAFLVATNPVVVQAAGLVTGADIKDDSVTGRDVREGSLGTVPAANRLGVLKSGQTQSGTFATSGAWTAGTAYLAFGITYPRPLAAPIDEAKIVDTAVNPDPEHCPGAGQAAPGYLCLYFNERNGLDAGYGYTEGPPYSQLGRSVGVGIYLEINDETPYADGVWTVTAP